MKCSDFDYHLPEHLIALHPLPERTQSRLLCLERRTGRRDHRVFSGVRDLLKPGDLLILNNSKVILGRLKGKKTTGGEVDILVERIFSSHQAKVLMGMSKKAKLHSRIEIKPGVFFTIEVLHGEGLYTVTLEGATSFDALLEEEGQLPLPLYFNREPDQQDLVRYQTVYSAHPGSVAAPTAGLHFDEALLGDLQQRGVQLGFVTLHVGAGTFRPVRTENILSHTMHAERLSVSSALVDTIKVTKKNGGRVIAVGTTSVRALETAAAFHGGAIGPYEGESDLFIYPGFPFQVIDGLITNFHLPQSTLLMLVAAWAGRENVLEAYQDAIEQKYRFFSYGDAMWVS